MAIPPPDILLGWNDVPERVDFGALFGWPEGTSRPVELEIGSGKGRFLIAAAARWPDHDFVGVEIVSSLCRRIRDKARRAGLANVRVLQVDGKDLLARRLPEASLARLHAYFPDPWPKRRHAKHRLFAGGVPADVARALAPGGELLHATDYDPYFREVVARLLASPAFVRVRPDAFGEIPRGGFDAIFEQAGVPVFRGAWQRLVAPG